MGKIEEISGAGDRKPPLLEFERLFQKKRGRRRSKKAESQKPTASATVVSPDLGANIDVKA